VYTWYQRLGGSPNPSTDTQVGTGAVFSLSATLTAGTYYYYCVVSATDAVSVTSGVATVMVIGAVIGEEYLQFNYDGDAAVSIISGKTLNIDASFAVSGNTSRTMIAALYNKEGRLIKFINRDAAASGGYVRFNLNFDIPANTPDDAYIKLYL
jgi:hypothetical protein